jgi:hypothetical protein
VDQKSYIPFVPIGGEISAVFAASAIVKGILRIGKHVRAPQGMYIDSMDMKMIEFTASHKARSFFGQGSGQKKAA